MRFLFCIFNAVQVMHTVTHVWLHAVGGGQTPPETKVILSSHNFNDTPSDGKLEGILDQMWKQGADVAKIATTATDISDCARVLTLVKSSLGMSLYKTWAFRHR